MLYLYLRIVNALKARQEGASLVEYALLVVLISIAAIVIMTTLGGQIKAAFQQVSDSLPAAAANP